MVEQRQPGLDVPLIENQEVDLATTLEPHTPRRKPHRLSGWAEVTGNGSFVRRSAIARSVHDLPLDVEV